MFLKSGNLRNPPDEQVLRATEVASSPSHPRFVTRALLRLRSQITEWLLAALLGVVMKIPAFVFLLLTLSAASAQRDFGTTVQRISVRVAFADGTCDALAQVTLSAHNGVMVEGTKNKGCEVAFMDLPEGTYRVNVSGKDLTTTEADRNIF